MASLHFVTLLEQLPKQSNKRLEMSARAAHTQCLVYSQPAQLWCCLRR